MIKLLQPPIKSPKKKKKSKKSKPTPTNTDNPTADNPTTPTTTNNPTATPTTTNDPTAPASSNVAETNPVGGVKMPKIEKSNGEFIVNGNKFQNLQAAQSRQCDIQHNLCFNKLNSSGGAEKVGFNNTDCDNQTNDCKSGPPVFA